MENLDLLEIRNQLDQIDTKLVSLFEERMRLCGEVAEYKITAGKAVYDREREKQKILSVKAQTHSEFNAQAADELFSQIMMISRRLQYQILEKYGKKSETGFIPVDSLSVSKARIVFQGVEGAYSHEAALKYFGEAADVFHVPFWEDAMMSVEEGSADYAVLPIENSSAGAVTDNYDLLVKYHNYIVGEIFLTVNHALLGLPESRIDGIKTVFSHPQALMQCSEYLNANKNWNQISAANTAGAAKKILEDQDLTQAAIASESAGRLYGLKVLKSDINHNKNNATRFIIVAKDPVYRKDAGKISICFEISHKIGTLYSILSNFIYNQVNMRMIESRPIVGKNWEYRFFVDIEGNLSDTSVKNALNGIREEAAAMRILGNY